MTTVTRWNPVRELITMREAMDQLFNENVARREYRTVNVLPVDAYAKNDDIVIVADIPGQKPEDLSITFEKDTLTIRGEFKAQTEVPNYLLRERLVGKFERTLTINTPIDADNIEATFDNGVLTLRLPKAETAKPRQISVKTASAN